VTGASHKRKKKSVHPHLKMINSNEQVHKEPGGNRKPIKQEET